MLKRSSQTHRLRLAPDTEACELMGIRTMLSEINENPVPKDLTELEQGIHQLY